jgi:hypothetical protein
MAGSGVAVAVAGIGVTVGAGGPALMVSRVVDAAPVAQPLRMASATTNAKAHAICAPVLRVVMRAILPASAENAGRLPPV